MIRNAPIFTQNPQEKSSRYFLEEKQYVAQQVDHIVDSHQQILEKNSQSDKLEYDHQNSSTPPYSMDYRVAGAETRRHETILLLPVATEYAGSKPEGATHTQRESDLIEKRRTGQCHFFHFFFIMNFSPYTTRHPNRECSGSWDRNSWWRGRRWSRWSAAETWNGPGESESSSGGSSSFAGQTAARWPCPLRGSPFPAAFMTRLNRMEHGRRILLFRKSQEEINSAGNIREGERMARKKSLFSLVTHSSNALSDVILCLPLLSALLNVLSERGAVQYSCLSPKYSPKKNFCGEITDFITKIFLVDF